MNDTDEEILRRLMHEYGTRGLAEGIAKVCRDYEADPERRFEVGAGWWEGEAKKFDLCS